MTIHSARPTGNRRGDMMNMMNVTLMMIILAFFIVLNSLSVPAETKKKAALGSLIGTLGILPGGLSPMKSKGKEVSLKPAPMLKERINLSMLLGRLETTAMHGKAGEKMSTIVTKGGLEITIESDVLFTPGTSRLKPLAYDLLAQTANILKAVKGNFRIEGHTSDRMPERSSYRGLMELSIAQSGAVARTILRKGGLKRNRLSVSGYGPFHPVKPNDSDENRKKNERIRIVYERKV